MKAALALSLLLLAGCSVRPDGSNGQRRDFAARGVSYALAYHRATDYFNQCVRGFVGFSPNITTGNIYADEHRAALQTVNGSGLVVARVNTAASRDGSQVSIITIKRAGSWNAKDLDAIQHAVETGHTVCK